MKNIGKQFEQDFSKSIPDYAMLYRLPDSAQSFGNSTALRFSRKSPFDFFLWDSKRRLLYALENKTVEGKSISFEREKNDNAVIHYHQIQGLNQYNKFEGVICGFIIFFREIETTVFLPINSFNNIVIDSEKKSLNYSDIVGSGFEYIIIHQTKKRTRYTYDIESLLSKASLIAKEDKNDEDRKQTESF